MNTNSKIVEIACLGEAALPSPLRRTSQPGDGKAKFVPERRYVRHPVEIAADGPPETEIWFEKAGAREKIFFDPKHTKAAIVTCGGISPGLNDVIRSLFIELYMNYGVKNILGIRHGYLGLNAQAGEPPLLLSMEIVEDIHREGGTILGTSRGPQEPAVMVDFLQKLRINVLFCIGGDGTQRGAHRIYEECSRRGAKIAIVGIPKTIDNDIQYCSRSFGLVSAVEQAEKVIDCAHVEAKGAVNGIGLVKVMGRDAGFIAANATLASQDVNFTLIPEVPFALYGEKGFLNVLRQRMLLRKHAVIVVAEGAGQDLLAVEKVERDASGNVKYGDIGVFLKQEINRFFAQQGPNIDLKYIDPSYIIRSVPANCDDSILCDQYARQAVHAVMAGKTDVLIGYQCNTFVHLPISLATAEKRRVEVEGELWTSVLAATGQPRFFE
ncbi:MAG: ATP-dependent 6-phosphofructokinase [Thermoguttaceae bacterium]|jgi:6-phosphofructokinase 1